MAIYNGQPQVARWLLQRGLRLKKRDMQLACPHSTKLVLCMIFKLSSKIRRAHLFHSASLQQKLWLLRALQLGSDNKATSEEEADACFARFNRHNDKTLEHKCLVTLANLIGQQSGTLEAGLKAVDSLPIFSDGKFNLRELITINLENSCNK